MLTRFRLLPGRARDWGGTIRALSGTGPNLRGQGGRPRKHSEKLNILRKRLLLLFLSIPRQNHFMVPFATVQI